MSGVIAILGFGEAGSLIARDLVTAGAAVRGFEWDVPVGIGTLITVDTTIPVDIAVVAAQVRRHHAPR